MAIRSQDSSVRFGNQNFFFCNAYETDPTYDYVVSMSNRGSLLVSRFTKSGSNDSARYWLGVATFPVDVAACVALGTYVLPNQLVSPLI